jgi:hypothetical protein
MKKLMSCSVLGFVLIILLLWSSMNSAPQGFYNGQILLPDHVHQDTLIVTDADWLNKHIDAATADGAIMELLNHSTEPLRK